MERNLIVKQSKPHRLYSFLKSLSIGTVLISAVTFVQFYWSMGTFSDRMSSGCLECRFVEDALLMSLITGIFLSAVFPLFPLKRYWSKLVLNFFC